MTGISQSCLYQKLFSNGLILTAWTHLFWWHKFTNARYRINIIWVIHSFHKAAANMVACNCHSRWKTMSSFRNSFVCLWNTVSQPEAALLQLPRGTIYLLVASCDKYEGLKTTRPQEVPSPQDLIADLSSFSNHFPLSSLVAYLITRERFCLNGCVLIKTSGNIWPFNHGR